MFRRTMTLATIGRTAVRIDTSWIMATAVIALLLAIAVFPTEYRGLGVATYWMGAASAVGLVASLLAHDIGRALAARHGTSATAPITVEALGRLAVDDEAPDGRTDVVTGLAGLAAAALLAVTAVAAGAAARRAGVGSALSGVLEYIGTMNAAILLLHLLPVFPLDGGRIVRGVLWMRKRDFQDATRAASRVGSNVAVVVMLLGAAAATRHPAGVAMVLVGFLLWRFASTSYRSVLQREVLRRTPVAMLMRADAVTIPRQLTVAEAMRAYFENDPAAVFAVVDEGRFVGSVARRDVAGLSRAEWHQQTVGAVAKHHGRDEAMSVAGTAFDAAVKIYRTGVPALPVVDGERLVGMISSSDIVRFLSRDFAGSVKQAAR